MTENEFNTFTQSFKSELIELIESLKSEIEINDDNEIDDPSELNSMDITISINKDCTSWSYQTGDNSFTGSCYGDPYWGVTSFTKDCCAADIAEYLIDDLAEQIEFDKE